MERDKEEEKRKKIKKIKQKKERKKIRVVLCCMIITVVPNPSFPLRLQIAKYISSKKILALRATPYLSIFFFN